MAYFEGTVEEFMRFLGGYARNRVQSLTSAYRKKIGKCEECGRIRNSWMQLICTVKSGL